MELDKVVMGETTLVGTNLGECQGLEDLQLQLCQSTADSSSDDFESDKEAMICIESDSEVEWEKAEEKGFEGIRCLMESQLGEVEEHSLNVQEGVDKIRGGLTNFSRGSMDRKSGGFRWGNARYLFGRGQTSD